MADAFQVGDDQALLALGVLAERYRTRDFGQHAGILGRTGFEQLGHARQTAGDVAGLLRFLRNTRQDLAHGNLLAVAHGDQRTHRERDVHRVIGAGDLDVFAVLVDQLDLRTHDDLAAARLGRDHDQRRQAGDFVDLLGNGNAFFDVLEAHRAAVLGHDRTGQRIPAGQTGAGLDRFAVANQDGGAIRDLVALALAAVVVEDGQFAGTRNRHTLALGVGDIAHRAGEADRAVGLGFHGAGQGRTRSGATDVERPHGELRARFADRLRGDDADGLAHVDVRTAAQIAAIAMRAQAVTRFARQRRADLDFVHAQAVDQVDQVFVEQGASRDGRFLRVGVDDVDRGHAAEDTVAQRFDDFTALDQGLHRVAMAGAAIVFGDHQILGHVDQAARQVARVRRLQRGIGQALARAVRRDEVLQYVQAFAEVGGNRGLDDRAVRLGHQAAHAGQLANLGGRTTGARVGHHVDRVERFLAHFLAMTVDDRLGGQLLHHRLADLVAGLAPDIDHVVVALLRGHQTRRVLLVDFLDLAAGLGQDAFLGLRDQHVFHGDRDAAARGQAEARLHQLVGKDHRVAQAATAERLVDQARDLFLLQGLVQHREGQALGQDLGQQRTADRRFMAVLDRLPLALLVALVLGQAYGDAGLQFDFAVVIGALHFRHVGKENAFALAVDAFAGRVVQAQHDILRRHDGRLAVGREQYVVRGQHQRTRFELRFERQRHVHGHLVAVEVGVEGGADQRVQLDGLAFDQHRLERLDAQAVQRRRTVEHDRVLADHLFEDVPHHRLLALDQLLGSLDGRGQAHHLQAIEDERLEQLERHQLGQAALVQLELRAHHDDRTARVVDALAQQVLAETTALALDHVGQRLELALVGAGHGLAAAAVVEQRVDGFLQHALFVAQNDLGRLQFEQALEAVVAVDDAAVQVVQVGGREAAAVQRHQRTQVRRQHGQHFHDHPFGLDAGLLEAFQHLQTLGDLLDLGFRAGGLELAAQRLDFAIDVDGAQQFAHGLGAHQGTEVVAVLFGLGQEVVIGHDLAALERRHAGLDHAPGFEVQHALDVAQRHVEHHAQARRQALEEPDVRNRAGQFDMAHALAAHLGDGDFHAALFADHATMLQALVLAAQAFVVLDGTEDLGAEQAVTLGLERTVVDRLGLANFAERPRTDLLGRGDADLDGIELLVLRDLLEEVE
ncbi:Uncharacterised protein [Bordetella pertussis]|nr:Uncharacterised protein [Bordetella pertussis]